MTNPTLAVPRETLARRIRVARGHEPGDVLLRGGSVVDVFTRRIYPANVVLADGWVAGVGPFDWDATTVHEIAGQFVMPGLIDAHIHVESTLLLPAALAAAIVPRGTTTLIADPHEVINVMGPPGLDVLTAAGRGVPLDVFYMASSCVPASEWEEAGATLDAAAVGKLMDRPEVIGLAEMMNFPGVLGGAPDVLDKVLATHAHRRPVDGHAPGLGGRDLQAYVAAGIRSDHESTAQEEALAKARLGMLVQVREGSAEHNLHDLLPLIAAGELGDWCLCSDDILPDDLLAHGHLDRLLKRVVAAGVPPAEAVRHATLIPARHYGLIDRGGVAPGYRADLVVVRSLTGFEPSLVFKSGALTASDGSYLGPAGEWTGRPPENTVKLPPLSEASFRLTLTHPEPLAARIVPGQIITKAEPSSPARDAAGVYAFDPARDVLLAANVERHGGSGKVGLGLTAGFGFTRHGALGSSVGHDAHNLVLVGTRPTELLAAARELARIGGGFVVVDDGAVTATVPLPVAGLLSTADVATVCGELNAAHAAARTLGCEVAAPFGILSFLPLSVIPELRVTTFGTFDVRAWQAVTL